MLKPVLGKHAVFVKGLVGLVAATVLAPPLLLAQQSIPMDADHWQVVEFHRWPASAPASEFKEVNGRKILRVFSAVALVRDLRLQDGVLEADVSPDPQGAFFGIAFRAESAKDFELIYFRPAASGTKEAVQYAPVLNGALTWQLFHGDGAQASADLTSKEWMHVTLEITGNTTTLSLDGKSVLRVPKLALGDRIGSVGFWGLFGGGSISNLSFSAKPARKTAPPFRSPGAAELKQWLISPAFDVSQRDPQSYPTDAMQWQAIEAEEDGRVILNRYVASPEIMPTPPRQAMVGTFPGSRVVYAKTTIESEGAGIRPLWIGYSDEAVVFINGVPIFNGKNAWRFRDDGSAAGLMDYNDRVFLPLKKGKNEILIAVTEFMGGWGFECRFDDAAPTD
jgi:hypothetical protein